MNTSVEEGKCYYVISHAYHHFLVRIAKLHGPQRAWCDRVVKVHSCRRGWTEFFVDGCKDDTTIMKFPAGEVTWIDIFEWRHEIP